MAQETVTPRKDLSLKPTWASIEIVIRGTTHLICNNWKTKNGEPRKSRTDPAIFGAQSPEEQFAEALYTVRGREDWDPAKIGKYGMPAYLIRSACLSVAKILEDWDLVNATHGSFFTEDVIVPITQVKPMPRRDIVNVNAGHGKKKEIPKYRAQFNRGWEMTIPAKIDTEVLPIVQLAGLLGHAGISIGIGEWRPERGGHHGKFRLLEINELQ